MMQRLARPFLLVLLAGQLGACSILPNWFGDDDKPRLPGDRLSVLALERSLEPDPRLADMAVALPRPYRNPAWPQAGGTPAHVLHHLELGDDLRTAWTASIGSGASRDQRIVASPVVAEGKVFAMDAEAQVTALEAAGGARLWRVDLVPEKEEAGALGGGVAYDRGRVYAATGYGEVVALSAADGEEIWRRRIGIPLRAAPTVDGNRVFVISYDNQLHALNTEDGAVAWTHAALTESAGLLGAASPAVEAGTVVVPFSSGELVALRADNGRVAWADSLVRSGRLTSLATINDINGRPVIDRGRVYAVGHSGRMVAIDLRSGERIWEQDIAAIQMPWVAGDFIYLVTLDAEVVALSRRDGRIRWVNQLARFEDPEDKTGPIVWYGPVLAGDRLVLVSSRGHGVSVSPYTGELLGTVALEGKASVAPVLADATLYILTANAILAALR